MISMGYYGLPYEKRDLLRLGRKYGGTIETQCCVINGNLDLIASRPEDVALRQLVAAQVERLGQALSNRAPQGAGG